MTDWQAELNGLTMGAGTPYAFTANGISGLGLPAMRTDDIDRVLQSGSWPGRDYYDVRTITFSLTILGNSAQNCLDLLSVLASAWRADANTDNNTINLYLRLPGRTVFMSGRPRRCEIDLTMLKNATAIADVQFVATDPTIYGNQLQSVTATDPILTRGHGFPHGFPLAFSTTVGPLEVPLTNSGTASTWITVRIFGPCEGPRLELVDIGTLDLNITLGVGDWLDVDFATGTCLLNSEAPRWPKQPGSTWWQLSPGTHQLRYRTQGDTIGSTASISWRSAWLSI